MGEYRYHEAAEIFPLCKRAIKELVVSIKANGLLEPIELYKDEIIDGRSRDIACPRAGVEPDYVDVTEIVDERYGGDVVEYCLVKNLHRRQLTTSQAAAVAVKAKRLRKKFDDAAKQRQREGQKKGGGDRRSKQAKTALRPPGLKPKGQQSRDDLAKVFPTSGRQIQRMQRVKDKCIPEVFEAVEEGAITATEADEQFSKIGKGEQFAALKKIKEEKTKPKEKKQKEKKLRTEEESTDPERRAAVRAETETFNFLKTSKLARLKKSNPYRAQSFRAVINWLRRIKEES